LNYTRFDGVDSNDFSASVGIVPSH
jgi:hypothetical protein